MPKPGENNNNNPQQDEVNLNAPQQGGENPVPVQNPQAAPGKDLAAHLKRNEDEFHKEEQILDLLKKRQDELLSYKSSQNELLDQRQKEIDVFDVNKREKVEINYKKELPKDLAAFEKQSDEVKEELTGKINEAINDSRKKQTAYTVPDKSIEVLKLNDLSSYNSLVKEVDDIRKKIQNDGEKDQPKVDFSRVKKATDNSSAKDFGIASYNLYETYKKTYQEKEEAYQKEFNNPEPAFQEYKRANEYINYQRLVARRMVLKQAIKQTAMGKNVGTCEHFADLEKQKKDPDKYATTSENITKKLIEATVKEEPALKAIGYDTKEKAGQLLADYFEIERKVNEYKPRIEKIATPEEKKWLSNHSSTKVENYYSKGVLKNEFSELKQLSDDYQPSLEPYEIRSRILRERNEARYNYYISAQSLRLLQRDAINEAINDANQSIKEHNEIEKKKEKSLKEWKTQADCDKKYLEDVDKRASEATSTRRKMMIGSMVVGFAARMAESIGDNVNKAGNTIAEGIVKGERVQVENELKELNKEKRLEIKASNAALKIAQNERQKAKTNASLAEIESHKDRKDRQKNVNYADKTGFAIRDAQDHLYKGMKASKKVVELDKKIKQKEIQLKEAKETEKIKLAEIEKKLSSQKFADNQKKLEQNKINQAANDMTDLATQLNIARQNLQIANVSKQDNSINISTEVLNDLMNAKTENRRQELSEEEAKILKNNKDLKEQMKKMQEYSDTLSSYLTPENLQKVDTIVGIVETLYSAYSTVTGYLDGKKEAKQQEEEQKKINGTAEEFRKQAKEEKDTKKANELNEKAEALENAAKKYDKDDDDFELNIKETIKGIKEKAESISNSMTGKGEKKDEGTIISNLTDLTLEAGMIVQVVSKKIQEISAGMEISLEEAQAREEAEKRFINAHNENKSLSPVDSARDDVKNQKELHNIVVEKDIAANKDAIALQENRVASARSARDEVLKAMNLFEQHQEEEERKRIDALYKEAEEKAKLDVMVDQVKEVVDARKVYEDAKKKEDEVREKHDKAKNELDKYQGALDYTKDEFEVKSAQFQNFSKDYMEKHLKASKLKSENKPFAEKKQEYLKESQTDIDTAKSTIRKTAAKSFFVNIANSAAKFSKSAVDQLSIGFAESIVKGRVKQMEDELAEKEKEYLLKGRTALAKDNLKLQHVKNAEKISKSIKNPDKELQTLEQAIKDPNAAAKVNISEKDLPTLDSKVKASSEDIQKYNYKKELIAAVQAEKRAQELQKERVDIGVEIQNKRSDLAKAKVQERNQLDRLYEEFKTSCNLDPEAARKIDIKTAANEIKSKVASEVVKKQLGTFEDPIDIFTSPVYSESDAAQRQVIKEQVKNIKLEKEIAEKGKRLEEISDKLKSVFTPKNMSRVDSVVTAAETLYGLYGSVKGFLSGDGGGKDEKEKEDEEEKNIAGKIKDIKDKAQSVRMGMMGEGDNKEEDALIVDNLMSITKSMREITDVVSSKIAEIAENYEMELDRQREIKMDAEREIESFNTLEAGNKGLSDGDKFDKVIDQLITDAKEISEDRNKSMLLTQNTVLELEKKVDDAQKEVDKIDPDLKEAEKVTQKAKAEYDRIRGIEEQKAKGLALNKARDDIRKNPAPEIDFGDALDTLFPRSEAEIANDQRYNQEKAERDQAERERNDRRMSQLSDIIDNLRDTGNAYTGHKNTGEFNDVITQLQDFVDNKDNTIQFRPDQTRNLEKALTAYLDHTGMDTAWHEKGNIRKENVLAALNLINPDKAKEYEQQANSVRRESKKIDLNTLMDKDTVKRDPNKKRNNNLPRADKNPPQDVQGPKPSKK